MTFDKWYEENTQLDRSDALAGWNAAIDAAAFIAIHEFGKGDVAKEIKQLESK